MKAKPAVMLSLCELGGYYNHLENGLTKLGYYARTEFLHYHIFAYKNNYKQSLWKIFAQNLSKIVRNPKIPLIFRLPFWAIHRFIAAPVYFFFCVFKYDVFVFAFKKTFFPFFLDLPLLRLFGKKIIFVFHGSDSRPPYLNGAFKNNSIASIVRKARAMKRDLICIEKYSDYIIAAISNSLFLEQATIDWFAIGLPVKIDENELSNILEKIEIPLVLHAPSNLEIKGTLLIRKAVEELLNEGYCFKYTELIGKTNTEVLSALKSCTFVIDQIFSDTPMASLAAEAAYLGKPSIVGGYELKEVNRLLGINRSPPSLLIEPTILSIKNAIKTLLENNELVDQLGAQAMTFVKTTWSVEKVAERWAKIIEDSPDPQWYFNPQDQSFFQGCGIEKEMRNHIVNTILNNYGEHALLLNRHLKAKNKLLEVTL